MTAAPGEDDPFLWLEDVDGERALQWVRARSDEAVAALESDPRCAALREAYREVLESSGQIPQVVRRGPWLYNLWRDAGHTRGLWRRTSLSSYLTPEPDWESVLDLDALARDEGENWVWGGAAALGPAYRRALVMLSRGGADAIVVREFDLVQRRFVDGGFHVPEAKTQVAWADDDTVYIGSDFGPGTLTDSGYPRCIRRWRRGEPLAAAPTVFEVEPGDVSATVQVDRTPGHERTWFTREVDFYRNRLYRLDAGGRLREIDKPLDATLHPWRERLLVRLRSDWDHRGRRWTAGSLLVADADGWLHRDDPRPEVLFTPTPGSALESFDTTRSSVLLVVMEHVVARLERCVHDGAGWRREPLPAPAHGTLSVTALHDPLLDDGPDGDDLAEALLLQHGGFLTPETLYLAASPGQELVPLKARPTFFDAGGMSVEQRFARSADGTAVPYFVVRPPGADDEPRPTLLYGYGGFEVSLAPFYSGEIGRGWLSRGGVFVLANLRGGGEYGPAWHQAAVREHKHRSHDDLIAVAEALVADGVTTPARLGIQGGSNGGLLVGAVMLQRPDLFGAVVCQVPLLDMRRYHRLLAGASWMAEYGDPDDPSDWSFIGRYSPYQRLAALRPGTRLPPVLLVTSTRDDRVHPGHARKMAARMRSLGHDVTYWENVEGGHGGAADHAQRARMKSLETTFLWQRLGG